MSPSRKTVLALFLAFLVPSVLLVALQEDSTNQAAPANQILPGYFFGTGPRAVLGGASATIVKARCLVRMVLVLGGWVSGGRVGRCNEVVQLASVWGALCLTYLAAARLMPPARACAAVLLAVVFVPWGYLKVGFATSWPYDLPSLFFAAFGLWAVVARRFVLFALALVLGTLNKETVVFLLPGYLLAEWGLVPRRTLLMHALILTGLFLVAYEAPRMVITGEGLPVFTASSMDADTPRWQYNVQHLLGQRNVSFFENIYWVFSIHLLPLFFLSALPRSLRAAYLAVPILVVPLFFCGNIHEFRLYNELIPLGAISTVFVVSRLLEASAGPASPPAVMADEPGSVKPTLTAASRQPVA